MPASFTGSPLLLTASLCGMLAGPVGAEDLPGSPGCQAALQALAQGEEAIAATAVGSSARRPDPDRQRSVLARLQPLRLRVAEACLGGLTTSPSPSSSQRSGAVAAPARPTAPLAPRPAAAPPVPPVHMPRVEAPVTVSHCNAATCLASDGSTLTRVGPTLVGSRGLCTVQGNFLRCP